MAQKKITDLDAAEAVAGTDLVEVVLDPSSTPSSARATVAQLMDSAPVQSVNGQTGTVVLDHTDVGADAAGSAASAEAAAKAASVPLTTGIVVVDSSTPVARPNAAIVLWLDDDTNAVAGDWRPATEA